jgi:hypothetical protein
VVSPIDHVVDDGTCKKWEQTVGGRDEDNAETDTDTIAVDVRECYKEEEVILIDGDSLEGVRRALVNHTLSQLARLLRSVRRGGGSQGRKIDVSNEMSWGSEKDMDCTKEFAARIDDS